MTDQQTPDDAPQAPQQPAPGVAELLKTLEPYLPLLGQVTDAVGAHQARATSHTTWLLAGIVVVLSGLAALSLWMNHVDTAEKIVIALVSFLGGTAIFGGGTKK